MKNNETELLYRALCYEDGHQRRTQHILKVYALSKLLGEKSKCTQKQCQILQAAAILHDIGIKYCKEHFQGDASLENQKKVAPHLVTYFLKEASYDESFIQPILNLVLKHHDYDTKKDLLLQLLIEADLIVNCYESHPNNLDHIKSLFITPYGKHLFELYEKNA